MVKLICHYDQEFRVCIYSIEVYSPVMGRHYSRGVKFTLLDFIRFINVLDIGLTIDDIEICYH